MKIIIQLASILFVLLFFTTCKKEIRYTFVEGIAQDYYTKQPIADARVELKGPGGDQYNTITAVYTNANGHFEFEKFRAEKSGDYYVNISGKNYDSYNKDGSGNVVTGKKNNLKPFITATCYVNVYVHNNTPFDENDKICGSFSFPEEKNPYIVESYEEYNFPKCYNGIPSNSGFSWRFSCNTHFEISWVVTKNNTISNFSNSVLLAPEIKDTIFHIYY
jgi:hypothetical protein